ncbi:MAG TPA: CRTAC1 family protein [Chthonomonadaceae bacterium]|nr:CRTAC1 family protein [Chthonomonadaceae bacterium]
MTGLAHPRYGSLLLMGLAVALLCGCRSTTALPIAGLSPSATAPPVLRDVAGEVGLHFRWGHGGRSPLTILETAGGGAGFLDYDGDGRLDILLVGDRVALYHNEGNGHFRDVSARSGLTAQGPLMGCAVGDFDNDGRPDIFLTGYGIARLYRNRTGQPSASGMLFEDVTARAGVGARGPLDWATSAGFADLDGDGFLDLVVCHYVQFRPQSRPYCDYPVAPGGGKVLAACPPFYYPPQRMTVYRNRGNGTFEDVTARFPRGHGNSLGLAFADYDDDGRMDFYVANDGLPGDLYHNQGGWRFENVGTASTTAYNENGKEQAGMGVDWADYDGDGRLDLIVATFQNEPRSLYHNEGHGLFSYASYTAGVGDATRARLAFGVGFLDYDNDGFPDLLLANGHVQDTIEKIHPPATYAQPMQLFHNRGDGTFAEAAREGGPAFARPIVGRALALGDLDNDGKVDALVVDLEGAPLLLHNESRDGNHWLGLRLVDRHGRRDAIGAKVTLETAAGKRLAESQTCRSYLAACDPRVHFGLGAERSVLRLIVRWPDGKTTVVQNPPVDRYLSVEER